MAQNTTDVEFIVIEKKNDGHAVGLGAHEFRIPPRVGEYIGMNDANGVGQAYQVVGVALAVDPVPTGCAGDLFVRHVGTDLDMRTRLIPPAPP